jgi:RNA polymerase sigma factor (sigma-70 family)
MTQQYTESERDVDSLASVASDAELITAVRGGDETAFATLWSRHEAAARRLARQISNPSNADDLVSEAFLRVLQALQGGAGPDGAFRPYLFSTLRRINIDNGRSYYTRVSLTEDERDLDLFQSDSAADVIVDDAQSSAAWRAWNSLPDTSKTLLWHLIIEEETPAQIAPLVGTTPNGVSSRAVRAKERLRQAFLQQHLLDADNEPCRQARRRFGEYVRDALSARDRTEVRAHLDTCDRCRSALFEISDINQTMKLIIGPVVLGGLTVAGYLGAGAAGAAGAAKISILAPIKYIGHALKNPVVAIGTTAATVAVAGVAIAGTFVLTSQNTTKDNPAAVTAPLVTTSSSGAPQLPVTVASATPTSIVTPSPTTPAATPTPASPTARKTTPSARKTAAKKVVPVPSLTLPTSSSSSVVVPPPPATVERTMPDFVDTLTAPVTTATITFTTSTGWDIARWKTSHTPASSSDPIPDDPTCGPAGQATLTCTWNALPAGLKVEFQVVVATDPPAPAGGTLTWTYTDDANTPWSGTENIPTS